MWKQNGPANGAPELADVPSPGIAKLGQARDFSAYPLGSICYTSFDTTGLKVHYRTTVRQLDLARTVSPSFIPGKRPGQKEEEFPTLCLVFL